MVLLPKWYCCVDIGAGDWPIELSAEAGWDQNVHSYLFHEFGDSAVIAAVPMAEPWFYFYQ